MKNKSYLYKKGFYGIETKNLHKKEIESLIKMENVEIVEEESVEEVQKTKNPELFVPILCPSEKQGYIRVTNQEFMMYATKNRFKFNCPEYYFIFHELLVSPDNKCSMQSIREKLNIPSKSFFYFVKKLSQNGLIERLSNGTIVLLENGVPQVKEKKSVEIPDSLYRNVPIYVQILRMIKEKKEGISTQDLKRELGMNSKQALHALKKVMGWNTNEIICMTGFEGKVRRNWYKMKEYHKEQTKKFIERIDEKERQSEENVVDADIRMRVIEEMVMRCGVAVYNKQFHDALADALGTKYAIDKKTIIKAAERSGKIEMVYVFIIYTQKRIVKNVLKDISIPETDKRVINAIAREGHTEFSIVTKNGLVEYSLMSPDAEIEKTIEPSEKKENDKAKKKQNESRSGLILSYFNSILFEKYSNRHHTETNGYIPDKQKRCKVLLDYCIKAEVPVIRSFALIDNLPLSIFFCLFPVSQPHFRQRVHLMYKEMDRDWEKETFASFRAIAPNSIQRHLAPRKHLRILESYIDELNAFGCIRKKDSADEYDVVNTLSDTQELQKEIYIEESIRKSLLEKMHVNAQVMQKKMNIDKINKSFLVHIAANCIRKEDISYQSKKDLLTLFTRNISKRKTFSYSDEEIHTWTISSICNENENELPEIKENIKERKNIMILIEKIKEKLHKNEKIDLLIHFLEYDYFVLERVIMSLKKMSVISLPYSVIQTNNLCAAPIQMTNEYKKAIREKLAYTEIFCFCNSFNNFMSSDRDIVYMNALLLFRYILHNGATNILQLHSKLPFLTLFEIEKICSVYDQVFSLHAYNIYTPNDWIVSFSLSSAM